MALGFNIPVSANPDQLQKDMDKNASIVTTGGQKMGAAAELVAAKTALLNKQISDSIIYSNQLAKKHGENSVEALKAAAGVATLKLRLEEASKVTATVGQSFSNVTRSGFNPLSNSINQLTREMPAFTYSVQTGFMALSNNIPIFVDSINSIKKANAELVASGQPVKSVFGQIAGAFLSWNTAISLGITAVTVFSPKIVEFVSELWNSDSALTAVTEAQKKYNVVTGGGANSVSAQIALLKEKNKLLLLEATAKMKGISVEMQMRENVSSAIISNENKILALQAKQRAIAKEMANDRRILINDTRPAQYEGLAQDIKALENQNNLYKEWQDILRETDRLTKILETPTVNKTTEKTSLKTEVNISGAASQDYLKGARESLAKLPTEFKMVGVNSATALAAGIASVKIPRIKFSETFAQAEADFKAFGQTMLNLAIGAAGDLAFAFGEMLGGGDWGKTLKAQLSQLMSQTANALIALGIALIPANPALAGAMLAGAAGLKIAAGVLSAQGGGGAPDSPIGSAGINTTGYTPSFVGASNSNQMNLRTELTGRRLYVVIDNEGRVRNR